MRTCLLQISGYKQLYQAVENVRKKPYDSGNAQHEKLLLKVSAGLVFQQAGSFNCVGSRSSFSPPVCLPLGECVIDFIDRERLYINNFLKIFFLISCTLVFCMCVCVFMCLLDLLEQEVHTVVSCQVNARN